MKTKLFTVLAICLYFASCIDAKKQNLDRHYNSDVSNLISHTCSYNLCPFKGQLTFANGCGNCEQGSDCFAIDSLHFIYPLWDYDQCENFLFTPVCY